MKFYFILICNNINIFTNILNTRESLSTAVKWHAPLLKASKPKLPTPEYKSKTLFPSRGPNISKN